MNSKESLLHIVESSVVDVVRRLQIDSADPWPVEDAIFNGELKADSASVMRVWIGMNGREAGIRQFPHSGRIFEIFYPLEWGGKTTKCRFC